MVDHVLGDGIGRKILRNRKRKLSDIRCKEINDTLEIKRLWRVQKFVRNFEISKESKLSSNQIIEK